MWVITLHSKSNVRMFEFESETGAKEAFEKLQGCKILSHVIYFNDRDFVEDK